MDRRAASFNMNLNDLANLGQIVGAIGVMITLVYLAI